VKYWCEHCGRALDETKIAWLELSFRTGRWYSDGKCPEEESQGGFPFGKACARTVLRQQAQIFATESASET